MTMLWAAIDPRLPWYIARSAGLVAWVLVTTSIICGLMVSTRLIDAKETPAWLLDLHSYLGALSLVFTMVHVVSLPFDDHAQIVVSEILVPFRSTARLGYAPEPVAWGIAGFYLLIAIQLTSLAQKRLPGRVWGALHLGSIPLFVVATIHGFRAGTERTNLLVLWIAIVGCLIVFFLLLFRLYSNIGGTESDATAVARVDDTPSNTLTITRAKGGLHQIAKGNEAVADKPGDAVVVVDLTAWAEEPSTTARR
jgi:hypothetical protein